MTSELLRLREVMDKLRSPGGCPWDAEQTHQSLLKYLLEESYYINSNFHKQKLLLHISSMNYYYDYLLENKIKVKYFNFNNIKYNNLLTKNNEYFMYDPIDKVMVKLFNKYNINYFDSPLFLNNYNDLLK